MKNEAFKILMNKIELEYEFSKHAISSCLFIEVISIHLIKLYPKAAITKRQEHIVHIKYVPAYNFIDFIIHYLNITVDGSLFIILQIHDYQLSSRRYEYESNHPLQYLGYKNTLNYLNDLFSLMLHPLLVSTHLMRVY